ncbi:hypothetical protein CA260_05060 [Dyella jiangningensis]|uniref:Transposase n=1 Tax=Dyella jiangningensis TaxID=1379159 RepID=A0A328P6N2_9GAMM|nr:hypothetical protein CA260_05060 [Dyella jiangningensis]
MGIDGRSLRVMQVRTGRYGRGAMLNTRVRLRTNARAAHSERSCRALIAWMHARRERFLAVLLIIRPRRVP